MDKKVVYTLVKTAEYGFGIMTEKNFVPSNDHKFWQMGNSAANFMRKFGILKLTVYLPDRAADTNFKQITATLNDVE